MKVGIFEYVSGGGMKDDIDQNILCEGYSILKSVTEDFQKAGHEVTTLLDSRLTKLKDDLKANNLEINSKQNNTPDILNNILKTVDLSLIIAPETREILSSFVQIAKSNTISLNSTPESIDLVSDKAKLAETLDKKGLPIPKTYFFTGEDEIEDIEKLFKTFSSSLVVKPVKGAGCEKVFRVKEKSKLKQALELIRRDNPKERVIIQEFVEGIPVSASLILNGVDAFPISLNLQHVSLDSPPESSQYYGGVTPFPHPYEFEAMNLSKKAAELFHGLTGYIGVDMMITPTGPILLEINPRITVPYVGLKRISKMNIAELIVKAATGESLPTSFETQGVSSFLKIQLNALKTIRRDVEVVCPKIQINGSDMNNIFISLKGNEESEVQKILAETMLPLNIT